MEVYEAALIAEVEDQLKPLEMPGIAAVSLVVGVAMTGFVAVVIVCRIRRGRNNYR